MFNGPGPGRPKGTPNKLTSQVKDAIEAAFDEVGGKEYLVKMAYKEPKAFMALLGKVLPKDINIEGHLSLGDLIDAAKAARQQPKP